MFYLTIVKSMDIEHVHFLGSIVAKTNRYYTFLLLNELKLNKSKKQLFPIDQHAFLWPHYSFKLWFCLTKFSSACNKRWFRGPCDGVVMSLRWWIGRILPRRILSWRILTRVDVDGSEANSWPTDRHWSRRLRRIQRKSLADWSFHTRGLLASCHDWNDSR